MAQEIWTAISGLASHQAMKRGNSNPQTPSSREALSSKFQIKRARLIWFSAFQFFSFSAFQLSAPAAHIVFNYSDFYAAAKNFVVRPAALLTV